MGRHRHWSEGFSFALAATICLGAFVLKTHWWVRDVWGVCDLVEAYPDFLLTPLCVAAGLGTGRRYPRIRRWCFAIAVVFILFKKTWLFADLWFNWLLPTAWNSDPGLLLACLIANFGLLSFAVGDEIRGRPRKDAQKTEHPT